MDISKEQTTNPDASAEIGRSTEMTYANPAVLNRFKWFLRPVEASLMSFREGKGRFRRRLATQWSWEADEKIISRVDQLCRNLSRHFETR